MMDPIRETFLSSLREANGDEAIQSIILGEMSNNFILRKLVILYKTTYSELDLRLRNWIAVPLIAAREDEVMKYKKDTPVFCPLRCLNIRNSEQGLN